MPNPVVAKTADQLRGGLDPVAPGARGLGSLARNPNCARLAAIMMSGVGMRDVLMGPYEKDEEEAERLDGQSHFALAGGNQFERVVFADDAALLLEAYRERGLLRPGEDRIVDLGKEVPGSSPNAVAERVRRTAELIGLKRQGHPDAPHVIIKPRFSIDHPCDLGTLEPDYLVGGDAERSYRPGDVKGYAYNGPTHTNEAKVWGARSQVAVGVVALRRVVARLGSVDPEAEVPAEADLIFRAGMVHGRLHLSRENVAGHVGAIDRALLHGERMMVEVASSLRPGDWIGDRAVIDAIAHYYTEECKGHCALAGVCRDEVRERQGLELLGRAALEQFRAARTVDRVCEWATGKGPAPVSPDEVELAGSLREMGRVLYSHIRPKR